MADRKLPPRVSDWSDKKWEKYAPNTSKTASIQRYVPSSTPILRSVPDSTEADLSNPYMIENTD